MLILKIIVVFLFFASYFITFIPTNAKLATYNQQSVMTGFSSSPIQLEDMLPEVDISSQYFATPMNETEPQPQARPPNIILIVCDDLDANLGTIDYMPNLKEHLIDQGLSLNDFYVTNPQCTPSRATLLRGQYTHNHQVYTNTKLHGGFTAFNRLGHEESNLATWLKSNGYRTVLLGKYLNGYPYPTNPTYVPPGWMEFYGWAQRNYNFRYYNYLLNENGKIIHYGEEPVDYMTDVLALKTVNFIHQSTADRIPFFIYLPVYAPHKPYTPAPRHKGLFSSFQAPRTPSFNEKNVKDKPNKIRNLPLLSEDQIKKIDKDYRKRVRTMQAVDEMIASIIKTLIETEQIDNTYIFFTSDNGIHMGQHRLLPGKRYLYEEDVRVHFVLRGPGIPAGITLSGYPAGNVDLAPTIADLAGISTPDFVDGRTLTPIFNFENTRVMDWREAYLLETYPEKNTTPKFIGLRTRRYKYVEHNTGEIEIYDLMYDPYELKNLAKKADPRLIEGLSSCLQRLYTCAGEQCLEADRCIETPIVDNPP